MGWLSFGRGRIRTTAPVARGPAVISGPLREWLSAAFTEGAAAEDRESAALDRLRAEPDETVRQLVDAYGRVGEDDYALRWALVHCAARVEHPVILPFFDQVLRDAIPPERSHDVHLFSTVAEETAIRLQALAGLATLAARGDSAAVDLLLEGLRHDSATVRAMASVELRELPEGRVADGAIESRLDPDEWSGLRSLRRRPVDEVEPPGVDVAGPDLGPPPRGDGPGPASRRGAPQLPDGGDHRG